jgi:hypothetical protein
LFVKEAACIQKSLSTLGLEALGTLSSGRGEAFLGASAATGVADALGAAALLAGAEGGVGAAALLAGEEGEAAALLAGEEGSVHAGERVVCGVVCGAGAALVAGAGAGALFAGAV